MAVRCLYLPLLAVIDPCSLVISSIMYLASHALLEFLFTLRSAHRQRLKRPTGLPTVTTAAGFTSNCFGCCRVSSAYRRMAFPARSYPAKTSLDASAL